jgi:hypothetical protein
MLSINWNEKAATLISKIKKEYPDVVFESLPTVEEAVRGKTCTKDMVGALQKELKKAEFDAKKSKVELARALVAEIHGDPRYEAGKFKKLDASLEAATKRLGQLSFDDEGKFSGESLTVEQTKINVDSIKEQWDKIVSTIGDGVGRPPVEIVVEVEELEKAYALHQEIQRYIPPPKGQFPAFDKPYHSSFAKAFDGLVFESETGKYESGKFTKKLQEGLKVADTIREIWPKVLEVYKESFLKNFEKLKVQWKDTIEQDEECSGWVTQLQELYSTVEEGDMDALASVSKLMTLVQEKHATKSGPPKEDWRKTLREVNTMEKALEKKIGARKFDDVYKYKYGGPLQEAYNDFVDLKKKTPRHEEKFFEHLEATKNYLIAQLKAPTQPQKKNSEKFEDDFDDDDNEEDDEEEDEEEEEDDYESSFVAEDHSSPRRRKPKNGEKRPRRGENDVDWEDLADLGALAVESTWKRFKDQKHKSIDVLRRLVKDQEKTYRVSFTNKAGEEIFAEDREALNGGLIAKWASDILQQYRQSTQDETNEITFRIVEQENKQNI